MIWDRRRALLEEDSIAKGRAEGEAKGRAEGEAKGRAEGEAKGRAEGEEKGIKALVQVFRKDMKLDDPTIIKRIMEMFELPEKTAKKYVTPSEDVEE